MRNNLLLILLLLAVSFKARADLRPYYLRINLTSDWEEAANGQAISFWIEFENTDTKQHPIVYPGNRKFGKKVIFFSFFSVKDDFYTEVFRENQEITIDTAFKGGDGFRYLKPGEKFRIPIFFNDEKNYDSHIEAHHRLPNLEEGNYQVLAWYQPWSCRLAEYAFNPIDPFGKDVNEKTNEGFFDMSLDGTQSNYLSFSISDTACSITPFQETKFCKESCKFCKAIEKDDWSKVEAEIDKQTLYKHAGERSRTDSTWRMKHRNVAWLGPDPQAILASLPTYTSRTVIYQNAEGYHYYVLKWQLGKIYRARSNFSRFFYWIGFRRPPFSTSEVDYCKLVTFQPY